MRIDGKGLRPDGTYTYAHVFFATEEAAAEHLTAISKLSGSKIERLT